MSHQHKDLAAGRWKQMAFVEQMANVGSEVSRSIKWKSKHNDDYLQRSFDRALELLDLTIEDSKNLVRPKELTRLREALVDYFIGTNQYVSTDGTWERYFLSFAYAARRNT